MRLLTDIIEEGRERFGDRLALAIRPRFRTISFTYKQLHQYACGIAKLLDDLGIKKGDRVLLWAPSSPFWMGTFFGCLLKGIIVVPIHVENTPEFIRRVTEQTKAKLLFKSSHLVLPKYPYSVQDIDLLGHLVQSSSRDCPRVDILPKDIVQILYTSGTTGSPKGVVLTHQNIVSNLRSTRNIIPITTRDRILSVLPLSHIFEQMVEFHVLTSGAPIFYAPALSSSIIRKILQARKITKFAAVPELLKRIMTRIKTRAKEEGKERLFSFLLRKALKIPSQRVRKLLFIKIHREFGGKLELIVSGGDQLEEPVARFWQALGIDVVQGYGLTETSPVISILEPGDKNIISIGKPVSGVRVKIAPDGEILVKGENVTPGYWQSPEKTKELFDRDGWFQTGDIGSIDKKGFLYIRGRKKLMILTGAGQNVYPKDIEAELNKESGVQDSAVVGLQKAGRTMIHAVLLGNIQRVDKLIARANKRLAGFQQIQSWSLWPFPDFPRTITRKVKHHEVLDFLQKHQAPRVMGEKVAAPILWKILAEVSGTPLGRVEEKTTIRNLGLDSLARVELTARIEEEFGVELDEADMKPETTVADLQNRIAKGIQKQERYPFKIWTLNPRILLLRRVAQRLILDPFVQFFASPSVEGLEHLKNLALPVLFYSNHLGSTDPAVIISSLPKHIRSRLAIATATDVIYEDPEFKKYEGLLTFLFNIYPFARQGQIKSSLEYTGRLIDQGFSILAFPEGKISTTGELLPLKEGAGFLAIEMQIPVVPIKLTGTQKNVLPGSRFPTIPKRSPVSIKFGKPLVFGLKDSVYEAQHAIEHALKTL